MSKLSNNSSDGFEIKISPDRMKATLVVLPGAHVSASAIITRLREMKVARFDDGMIIESLEARKDAALSIEVATGTAPLEARSERVDYCVPIVDAKFCAGIRVVAGQIVATVTPGAAGTPGCDVFGQPVGCEGRAPLQIGRNLVFGARQIVCEKQGSLHLNGNVLSVEPLLELTEHEANSRAIDFDGDAAIRGSLREGRIVKITGGLTVSGTIEAVQLNTGGSAIVQEGIIGERTGKYMIGGHLRCRFLSGGFIIARQEVFVQSGITGSKLVCGSRLTVQMGSIVGGIVAANSGIECCTLGNSAGTPTLIEAGEGIASRSFLASLSQQIAVDQKRIRAVRGAIEPLLKMMKTLTAAQREKVTEMLYEADELELATNKMVADMGNQTRIFAENAHAKVLVENAVYPGVTVRFANVKTTFITALKGPFSLEPHKSNGVIEVVLTSRTDQSKMILPSHPIDLAPEPSSAVTFDSKAA